MRSIQRKERFAEHAKKGEICGACKERGYLRNMQTKGRFAEHAKKVVISEAYTEMGN